MGTSVYSRRHRAEGLAKLVEPGVRIRAEHLYEQLDSLQPAPSNVIVTPQGAVKVLDFVLAKLSESGEADAYAETIHGEGSPLTEEGTILGTAAYMSPEQADGKAVDSRSDVFSFGLVLYEMATGQRAFPSGSKLSSLSAVLYKDPRSASQAVAAVLAELDRIVARCLRKIRSGAGRPWRT